jgi:acyl carrier protein
MEISGILFCVSFGLVATFIVTIMLRDWFRKRRLVQKLRHRTPSDDDQFRKFFADPKRAELAIRVRRVLAANLDLPLDGLTPGDRLDEDLNAELPTNPDLFWELETELGIKTDVEDLDSHEKTLERLATFADLVDYIERKAAAPASPTPGKNEDEKPSRTYDLAIRSIPVWCVVGFLTAVAGIIIQNKKFMDAGGLIFLSGFVVWGLANGGEMLRNIIRGLRGLSFKEIVSHPWPLMILIGLSLFFLWVGGIVLWGILKNLLAAR